ncbi:MAG: HEAT repeat domain-containing protein, partial [Arenicellales bacterium]|nr:HEAT repeat domain-containing protein [Arenicellales bacterium]
MNAEPARDVVAAALRGVLERDNSLSRCCAVRALGRLQVDDRDTLECLIALLHDPDPDVRLDVAVMLGSSGQSEAVTPLVESLLNDPEGEVRIEAARAL